MKGSPRFSVACALTVLVPAVPVLADPPETIELVGVVRDFKKSHPDFDVPAVDGLGHYAANVVTQLNPENRPVFDGGGFKVGNEWKNGAGHPIAPHMFSYSASGGTVLLVNGPNISGNPTIDTWDSTAGPYGGANVGGTPIYQSGATMPDVTVPTGLPPEVPEYRLTSNATTTLGTDLHCDVFEMTGNHTLQITADVTILVDVEFNLHNQATIQIMPGASLSIYMLGTAALDNHCYINLPSNSGDPARCQLYYLGTGTFTLSNNIGVYAQIVAPSGGLNIGNNADLWGTYVGQDLTMANSGDLHIDTQGNGVSGQMCGVPLDDDAGTALVASTGDITSSATYDQWYREELGVSIGATHAITLVLDPGTGIYEFTDDAMYPIDGILYGDEDDPHNYYFTYALEADFAYEACTGQFMEFAGADDIWVFIDRDMGIDLGGLIPGTEQRIELDRLGLDPGAAHTMRLFYAHRYEGPPALTVRTNVELIPVAVMARVSVPGD